MGIKLSDLHKMSAQQTWEEVCVSPSGIPFQAGAPEYPDGSFIRTLRETAERDLYFFGKTIMGRKYLMPNLHLSVCGFLQKRIPYRKGLLLPREHAKTSVVSHCLPVHIMIQPAATNMYFPNMEGSECRVILACETIGRAQKHVRVIETAFESNKLIRTLWPHRCWDNPRRESKKWNENEMIIPRTVEYPEPTLMAIGVGGAITGARPNVLIKDDLISLEARNSPTVMETAIEWHIASRALLESYEESTGLQSLEWIIGTRWAVYDLYQYIIDNDPTVEWMIRSIVEPNNEGVLTPIYPEFYPLSRIDELRAQFGSLFPLIYMNQAFDPSLVDFDLSKVRYFTLDADQNIILAFDERDNKIVAAISIGDDDLEGIGSAGMPKGARLTSHMLDAYVSKGRSEFMRFRSA